MKNALKQRSFPGDTTAEDWDGRRFHFWRTDTHGKEGIARSGREGMKRPDRVRFVWCEEHKDFEARHFHITANEALYWALDREAKSPADPVGLQEEKK